MNPIKFDAALADWWCGVNARFAGCLTSADLFRNVDAEIRALGFDCFAYIYRPSIPFNQSDTCINGSYPGEWIAHYRHNNYGAIDPSVIKAREVGFVLWSEHEEMMRSQLFCEAREWNLNVGATFMLRGRDQTVHVMGVARQSGPVAATEALLLKLKLRCILELIEENLILTDVVKPSQVFLTKRELEVLRWIGDGKCSQTISKILGISEDTVNFHIKGIQRKFGSGNRILAAAYAAALGVI